MEPNFQAIRPWEHVVTSADGHIFHLGMGEQMAQLEPEVEDFSPPGGTILLGTLIEEPGIGEKGVSMRCHNESGWHRIQEF